jgi:hypothetical protein
MATMYYVSQAVEAPEDDERAGRVTVTVHEDGRRFDWREVTEDLIQIHSAGLRLSNASVSVRHRGSWFYVDDSDLEGKSTFALLEQLFALQAGEIASEGPILTLPVGR